MSIFSELEALLISYADRVPLEVFAIVASFIEEVVAPVPSPAVMVVSGSLADVQGYAITGIIVLALLGSLGKLLGALLVYKIADRAEDLLSGRFAKFFGVTHAQIESFGKRLGNGWKDYVLLTVFRALPIVPSSLISVGCGVLKVNLRLYAFATYVGTVMRDFVYLYVGYVGTGAAKAFIEQSSSIESLVQVGVLLALMAGLAYLYWRHRG